jgi:hypothetical protein
VGGRGTQSGLVEETVRDSEGACVDLAHTKAPTGEAWIGDEAALVAPRIPARERGGLEVPNVEVVGRSSMSVGQGATEAVRSEATKRGRKQQD